MVTGAVVMLISFNLATVVANVYWPQDQWVALIVMVFAIACAVGLRGFFGRISIFLALMSGTVLSWVLDRVFGMISSLDPASGKITDHFRLNWDAVTSAPWIGFPPHTSMVGGHEIVGWHTPTLSMAAILLVLPAVIALIAENTGHVKAVAEMTGTDLDGVMGKALPRPGSTPRPRTTLPRWSPSWSGSHRSSGLLSPRPRVACSAGSPSSCTA